MTSILLTNPQVLHRWRRLRRQWPLLPPPHGMIFSDWRSYTREVCSGNIPGKMNPLLPSFSVSSTADMSLNASLLVLHLGRAQLDRSFSHLKKTVIHSSSVLSNLSSSWTSKPPLEVKHMLDTTALDQPGGPKSLSYSLDRLLAWEKKLYEEVKAREGLKIEHEKKLSKLQSQDGKHLMIAAAITFLMLL